ncbi:type II toxin-antitoxin system YafQ family toxin [Mariniphaga sp.]|uniref:type II toxin-antitoxin system RelE/ParE family toxin n=1 Tax=Mariniphaga sp. TaxID=1954475 RepID=UPI003569DBD2
MYKLKTTNRFEKDFVKCVRRNYNLNALNEALELLENSGKLPKQFKTHPLSGKYKGFWECHIRPDWLLIWRQNDKTKIIELTRTGTHSDLFR